MTERTFQYNGATVSIRRAKVRDKVSIGAILRKLDIAEGDEEGNIAGYAFARFMVLSDVEGDLGFALPQVTDDAETIHAAIESFLDADGDLYDGLIGALNRADTPTGDPDLQPGADAKKK
jgi:hypothetical protein